MQTADIFYTADDGLTLFAKAYGPQDSPLSVLCMHGLTRNHTDFEPMITALELPYRFIAVDVRGRGRSDRSPNAETYTPLVYAADMRCLLDHLEIERSALIGTSMGGLISMVMTHQMAHRIRGVVINDIGPVVEQAGLDRIASYASAPQPLPGWGAARDVVARTQSAIFPHYTHEDWMAFALRTYRELDDGRVIADYDPEITRTLSDVRPTWKTRFAMWRLFGKMKLTPLMILRGETSDILSAKTAEKMAKRNKTAQPVTVLGVGHAPMLDEPSALVAIRDFLKSL